jgi:PAS domain S-box-containing protein
VNPAYTRITGLTADEVIGKPAAVDISEGESIHMKVLKTRQPVRGVNMRVGENNNEVIVNVAPIIVDRQVRGSVGVIHDITEMRNLMNELDRARTIIRKLESTYTFDDVYGKSADIEIAIEQAKLAARNSLPVLLRGEAGSGKELFAHAIHSESDQKFSKFVRVNCTNHPVNLEAELFGKHGDTNTNEFNDSLFVQSKNGTLFLDEIVDMPLEVQEKILIYLREGIIYPVGDEDPIRIPVRIIAASSKNLEKAMHNGTFLEDLYYLLNRISIQIPSLRSRKEDIPVIVENILIKLNQEFGMNVKALSNEAQNFLKRFDWPGNVRELENVLSRAMIYSNQGKTILELEDITKSLFTENHAEEESVLPEKSTLASIMDDYEKTILETALRENDGNKSVTANRLGISLRSLYYKLEKFNLV